MSDKTQTIASGIEESNSAVKEISSTVSYLQDMAEGLKALVNKFRI